MVRRSRSPIKRGDGLLPLEGEAEVALRDDRQDPAQILLVERAVEAVTLGDVGELRSACRRAGGIELHRVGLDPAPRRQVDHVEGDDRDQTPARPPCRRGVVRGRPPSLHPLQCSDLNDSRSCRTGSGWRRGTCLRRARRPAPRRRCRRPRRTSRCTGSPRAGSHLRARGPTVLADDLQHPPVPKIVRDVQSIERLRWRIAWSRWKRVKPVLGSLASFSSSSPSVMTLPIVK